MSLSTLTHYEKYDIYKALSVFQNHPEFLGEGIQSIVDGCKNRGISGVTEASVRHLLATGVSKPLTRDTTLTRIEVVNTAIQRWTERPKKTVGFPSFESPKSASSVYYSGRFYSAKSVLHYLQFVFCVTTIHEVIVESYRYMYGNDLTEKHGAYLGRVILDCKNSSQVPTFVLEVFYQLKYSQ